MLDSCMLYRHEMPLRWKLLALLGSVLAYHVASATHSSARKQPLYTSARKIHTGRAVRAEHYSHSGKLLTPCMLQPCACTCTASTAQVWLATGPAILYSLAGAALPSLTASLSRPASGKRIFTMNSSDLLSPMSAGRASKRPGHAAEYSIQGVQEGFIYVYDMPGEFTDDLTQLPVQWHPSQYDYDQVRCTQYVYSASA